MNAGVFTLPHFDSGVQGKLLPYLHFYLFNTYKPRCPYLIQDKDKATLGVYKMSRKKLDGNILTSGG